MGIVRGRRPGGSFIYFLPELYILKGMGFHDNTMYFESKATPTKKIFTIRFPYDILFTLAWDAIEREQLSRYDRSDKVSDQLKMLSMIAEKIESRGVEESDNEELLL